MRIRGLRGSKLESMINITIDDYRKKKLALIQKIPTPITPIKINSQKGQITLAYFDKKSTVDYIGIVQEIAVCFDAKESKTDKFPLSNIHKHQYDFMKDFESQGGASFLLIYFEKHDVVYYMRFSELSKFWKKTYFTFDDLDERYMINVKNKIKVDFLPKLQLDIDDR